VIDNIQFNQPTRQKATRLRILLLELFGEVASSKSIIGGSLSSVHAIVTRCFSPRGFIATKSVAPKADLNELNSRDYSA
jgi:hypothetical protein